MYFARCARTAFATPTAPQGKRRYDHKQRGFGGQTKPIFHKKVRKNLSSDLAQLYIYVHTLEYVPLIMKQEAGSTHAEGGGGSNPSPVV